MQQNPGAPHLKPNAERNESAPNLMRRRHYAAILLVAAGLVMGACVPTSLGMSAGNWHRTVLFLVTVVGALVQPYSITVVILLGVVAGLLLGVITPDQAFKGYSNEVTWTVLLSLMLGGAINETGIGRRVALRLISYIGSNALGLVYSLVIADLALAPATPSNTARSGGIIYPIALNLARVSGSEPGSTAGRLGSYLLFAIFQANVITSAMFLSAMALNPVAVEFTRQSTGANVSWASWFVAASLPGFASLILIPYFIYRIYPPEMRSTPNARAHARLELARMGPMRGREKRLILILILLIGVWVTAGFHGTPSVVALLAAVCCLVVCGVVELELFLKNEVAWATFLWVGGILSLAGALEKSSFAELTGRLIHAAGLGDGIMTLVVLAMIYFFLHYAFASMTAQMLLLYVGFLTAAVAAGAPPVLSSLVFAFLSSLYACLTYYGSAAAAIYFSSGYIDRGAWLRIGFAVGVVNLLIWLGVGIPWCKAVGIW